MRVPTRGDVWERRGHTGFGCVVAAPRVDCVPVGGCLEPRNVPLNLAEKTKPRGSGTIPGTRTPKAESRYVLFSAGTRTTMRACTRGDGAGAHGSAASWRRRALGAFVRVAGSRAARSSSRRMPARRRCVSYGERGHASRVELLGWARPLGACRGVMRMLPRRVGARGFVEADSAGFEEAFAEEPGRGIEDWDLFVVFPERPRS
jgi:hypothetical protein